MSPDPPAPSHLAKRSRAALERLLTAAQEVLATQGFEEFTIAAVAERVGVSVGGVYRRFTGKEQLRSAVIDRSLGDLQISIADALSAPPEPGIVGVIGALTRGFAHYLDRSGQLYAAVHYAPRAPDRHETGLAAALGVQRLFLDAASPHRAGQCAGMPRPRAMMLR